MTETNAKARPLGAWMDVLAQIDRSLRESLERTPEPEALPPSPEIDGSPLARLDQRLAAWQNSLESAQTQASAANARLEGEQKALAGWLEKLEQVRLTFTTWIDGQADHPA